MEMQEITIFIYITCLFYQFKFQKKIDNFGYGGFGNPPLFSIISIFLLIKLLLLFLSSNLQLRKYNNFNKKIAMIKK